MNFLKYNLIVLLFCIAVFKVKAQSNRIVIKNVNVIPMHRDTILSNHDVLLIDNKIAKITPHNSDSTYHANKVINGMNKYLLPGFAEMHFHNQTNIKNEFKLLIANGVTTARNMAEDKKQDQIANKALSKKLELAPLYYTTGPYLQKKDLGSIEDAKRIVEQHKNRGYDFIKLADNFDKEVYLTLLEEAQKADIPVIGHGQRELPLEYTLRMKSIAHIEEFMNIFTKEQKVDSNFLMDAAKQIKASGVYVSPTLGIYDMISNYADDEKHKKLIASKKIKYLPDYYANYWKSDSVHYRKYKWFTAKESLVRLQSELEWQQKFTKILNEEGVYLMASSDTYGLFLPGFSIHRELELINASGLSTYETLKTATIIPAHYLNTISQEGTIHEGKNANLVLLDKSPIDDIKHTKTIVGVFVKGKWLDRKALDKLLLEVETSHQSKD